MQNKTQEPNHPTVYQWLNVSAYRKAEPFVGMVCDLGESGTSEHRYYMEPLLETTVLGKPNTDSLCTREDSRSYSCDDCQTDISPKPPTALQDTALPGFP